MVSTLYMAKDIQDKWWVHAQRYSGYMVYTLLGISRIYGVYMARDIQDIWCAHGQRYPGYRVCTWLDTSRIQGVYMARYLQGIGCVHGQIPPGYRVCTWLDTSRVQGVYMARYLQGIGCVHGQIPPGYKVFVSCRFMNNGREFSNDLQLCNASQFKGVYVFPSCNIIVEVHTEHNWSSLKSHSLRVTSIVVSIKCTTIYSINQCRLHTTQIVTKPHCTLQLNKLNKENKEISIITNPISILHNQISE